MWDGNMFDGDNIQVEITAYCVHNYVEIRLFKYISLTDCECLMIFVVSQVFLIKQSAFSTRCVWFGRCTLKRYNV